MQHDEGFTKYVAASIEAVRQMLATRGGASTAPDIVPIAIDDVFGLHVSLSRTFVLRYEQIDGFIEDLRQAVRWTRR
jgi:hypothetical protein